MTSTFKPLGVPMNHPSRHGSSRIHQLLFAIFFIATCAVSTGAIAQFDIKKLGNPSTQAASDKVQTDQVRAELLAHAPDGVDAGKTIWVGLRLTHQPHWHTYWKNPGDSG